MRSENFNICSVAAMELSIPIEKRNKEEEKTRSVAHSLFTHSGIHFFFLIRLSLLLLLKLDLLLYLIFVVVVILELYEFFSLVCI